eukprot:2949266-Rhodomonas_salina.2
MASKNTQGEGKMGDTRGLLESGRGLWTWMLWMELEPAVEASRYAPLLSSKACAHGPTIIVGLLEPGAASDLTSSDRFGGPTKAGGVSVNVTTSESRLLQACDRLSYGGCMLMTVLVHAACGVEQKFKVAMKAGMSGTGTVYGGGVGFSPRPDEMGPKKGIGRGRPPPRAVGLGVGVGKEPMFGREISEIPSIISEESESQLQFDEPAMPGMERERSGMSEIERERSGIPEMERERSENEQEKKERQDEAVNAFQ